ncbi:hypothetical protein SGFS_098270 [Streptomyces graminofaciens]|uniref:Uncharacterized protein n=1 Tax=Streptomyces graminofaciens TaxID=68212 RepID=A0ABM7FK86_9ACTN|nr:hypothetical protein SGFS_098270 [Streptomyces graminofaciens]
MAAAAAAATDVTLLVNNAGINTMNDLVNGDPDQIELEMSTAFYGPLRMIRAFAPILKAVAAGRSSTSCRRPLGSLPSTGAPTTRPKPLPGA